MYVYGGLFWTIVIGTGMWLFAHAMRDEWHSWKAEKAQPEYQENMERIRKARIIYRSWNRAQRNQYLLDTVGMTLREKQAYTLSKAHSEA